MSLFSRALMAGCLLVLASGTSLDAQTVDDRPGFRLGPLRLIPRIALTNVGVDSNTFNDESNPTRDVTATFTPGLDSSLRIGRVQLTGQSNLEFVYSRESTGQRSMGYGLQGRAEIGLGALTPFVIAGNGVTFRRPNAEIDDRVRQETPSLGAGISARIGSRLTVAAEALRSEPKFGSGTTGTELAEELNRRTEEARLSLGIVLTPLTTLTFSGSSMVERFESSPFRNVNNVTLQGGVLMRPLALISGSAFVGVRKTSSAGGEFPELTSIVSSVDLQYVWRESTQFGVGVNRGTEFSAEADQPYYLSTRFSLSVAQAILGRWDVVGRASRESLDYLRAVPSDPASDGGKRRDVVESYGAGAGFFVRPDVRLGFDADQVRRRSPESGQSYEGLRFGGSVTYAYE